jgi:hypothetical protein
LSWLIKFDYRASHCEQANQATVRLRDAGFCLESGQNGSIFGKKQHEYGRNRTALFTDW